MHFADVAPDVGDNIVQEIGGGHGRALFDFNDNLLVFAFGFLHEITGLVDVGHQGADRFPALHADIGVRVGEQCLAVVVQPLHSSDDAFVVIMDGNFRIDPEDDGAGIGQSFRRYRAAFRRRFGGGGGVSAPGEHAGAENEGQSGGKDCREVQLFHNQFSFCQFSGGLVVFCKKNTEGALPNRGRPALFFRREFFSRELPVLLLTEKGYGTPGFKSGSRGNFFGWRRSFSAGIGRLRGGLGKSGVCLHIFI